MAYEGYTRYGGVEFLNIARTARLAETMGLPSVWVTGYDTAWIQTALGDPFYGDVENAPWYNEDTQESKEFAGFLPLSVDGLGSSTLSASTTEYITDGGRTGAPRSSTLNLVFDVRAVGSSERGVEYGLRWLKKQLRSTSGLFGQGGALEYFSTADSDATIRHRRKVRASRGVSITNKRSEGRINLWRFTFTMVADDPFEYSAPESVITELGPTATPATGPFVTSSGSESLIESPCPAYDYTPIYDPLFPALVPSPTAPDLLPAGWGIEDGVEFTRYWARVDSPEPTTINRVPVITLQSPDESRMIRVSFWPIDSDVTDQCDPQFSVVVSYLPPDVDFVIDGEKQVAYVWDGFNPSVRRADSLIYSPDANPLDWTTVSDPDGFLVTLDLFGVEDVKAVIALVQKSD